MAKPQIVIKPGQSRPYTCGLLELVDWGVLDRDQLIRDLLMWMSEADVETWCKKHLRDEDNDCMIGPEDEDDEDDT